MYSTRTHYITSHQPVSEYIYIFPDRWMIEVFIRIYRRFPRQGAHHGMGIIHVWTQECDAEFNKWSESHLWSGVEWSAGSTYEAIQQHLT